MKSHQTINSLPPKLHYKIVSVSLKRTRWAIIWRTICFKVVIFIAIKL